MLLWLREAVTPFAQLAPWVVLLSAAFVFPLLFFVTAPYGRHYRPGWGPTVPTRVAWVVMEAVSFVVFGLLWAAHPLLGAPVVTGLGLLWLVHYGQRSFVFPALMRGDDDKRQPVLTMGLAIVFNVFNACGNGAALADRPVDAAFLLGAGLFAVGMVMNLHADAVLRRLRGPGETGYKIPHGGLYGWVSSPNYLGEILEWVGFAVAAQTLAAWAFVAFTCANLVPRARAHQRWYRQTFADYPADRRALVPFLW